MDGAVPGGALPGPLDAFIGREDELMAVRAGLLADRLVTLTGPGGCGKTRLAVEGASFAERARFVDLGSLRAPGRVADRARIALGAPEHPGQDPLATVVAAVGDRELLVVLDNCEHVVDDAAATVAGLLAACPGVRVLATSREPLRVPGERVLEVPALAVPSTDDVGSVVAADSVRLLLDRLSLRGRDLDVTPTAAPVLAALVRRLDGLPLAIELAAVQIGRLGLNATADGIEDQLALLRGGTRTASPRHQAIRASIAWSCALLDEEEQRVLDQLAIFRGGFDLAAAVAVLDPRPSPVDGAHLVGRLVEASLVQRSADGRFTMLESVRQFGRERLDANAEVVGARDRHLDWVAGLVGDAGHEMVDGSRATWLDRIEANVDNVRAALDWARTSGRTTDLVDLVFHLTSFWKLHGHVVEGRRLLDEALALEADVPDASVVRARWARADLAYWAGQLDEAAAEAEAARAGAVAIGDVRSAARAEWTLGNVENFVVGPVAGARRAEAALVLARRADDAWLQGVALESLAIATLHEGRLDAVPAVLADADAVADETGSPQLTLWNLAAAETLALHRCDHDAVERHHRRGMAGAAALVDPGATGLLRLTYAESLLQRGRVDESRQIVHDDLASFEATGHRSLAPAFWFLAFVLAFGSDVELADRARCELERAAERAAFWRAMARGARAFDEVARSAPSARGTVAEAVDAATALPLPWLTTALLPLAALVELQDDVGAAERRFHQGLALSLECGYPARALEGVQGLAVCAAVRGEATEAARLLGAVEAASRRRGIQGPAWASALVPSIRSGLIEHLGDEPFAAAWDGGAVLDLDGAVARVRRLRGPRRRPVDGWASLTPAEGRVVELAAEGLSNPEIADRLFVSRGTVKTHLAHAYAKLRVTNRTELAALVATRRGPRPG